MSISGNLGLPVRARSRSIVFITAGIISFKSFQQPSRGFGGSCANEIQFTGKRESMQPAVRLLLGYALIVMFSTPLGVAQASKSSEQTIQTQPQTSGAQTTAPAQILSTESFQKLANKVRHELVMLPYYDVYDNLYFRIDGRTVTLLGQTPNPNTKSSAGNVVKHIEGVDKVINNIEVLPPSPADQRIRRATYQAIYSYGPLFKYSHGTVPPIHIIVKNGRVTLEGIVDSESDKQMAGMRANQVPGTFQITNNLRVINPAGEDKKKKN
jgi:hyperosmotically inducible protein